VGNCAQVALRIFSRRLFADFSLLVFAINLGPFPQSYPSLTGIAAGYGLVAMHRYSPTNEADYAPHVMFPVNAAQQHAFFISQLCNRYSVWLKSA
jgi:hypothetical protein